MKPLLLVLLVGSLSGCYARGRASVAQPTYGSVVVDHREHPRPFPPPQEHRHHDGCGHVWTGTTWVSLEAAAALCIGNPFCAGARVGGGVGLPR